MYLNNVSQISACIDLQYNELVGSVDFPKLIYKRFSCYKYQSITIPGPISNSSLERLPEFNER